jgi:hypothetical protein
MPKGAAVELGIGVNATLRKSYAGHRNQPYLRDSQTGALSRGRRRRKNHLFCEGDKAANQSKHERGEDGGID